VAARTTAVLERNTKAAVDIRDLSHRYPGVEALRAFTLSVSAGQFVALTGPNGSGKTTLLEILATLLVPTRGDVAVAGHDVRTHARDVRRAIAHCPSGNTSFWPRLTGAENLRFFAVMGGRADAGGAERVMATAADVGLDPATLGRQVRTYSDGQAQRLNLARALLRDASIWLIDEPTRSLDPEGQAAMWTLIRDRARARRATVIAATHDLAGVSGIADLTVSLT
jgi:ABC-2 type transport system ATP-binding protein